MAHEFQRVFATSAFYAYIALRVIHVTLLEGSRENMSGAGGTGNVAEAARLGQGQGGPETSVTQSATRTVPFIPFRAE